MRVGEITDGILLPSSDDDSFPMLGLVDDYGDTFFSSMQMRRVLPELEHLMKLETDSDSLVFLGEVKELAAECERTPHSFLVFVGD